jgi:hypothetical protein
MSFASPAKEVPMPARSNKALALSLGLLGCLACSSSPLPGGPSSGNAGTRSQGPGTAGGGGPGTAGAAGGGQAGDNGGPGTAGDNGSGTAGANATAGSGGAGTAGDNGSGTAGASGTAGSGGPGTAGSMGTAGGGGAPGTAGSMGTAGAGTAGSGADPCGTPPWRPLHVTAAAGFHTHGGNAAMDNRVTPLGKLVVDLGVSGASFPSWVVQRGYHGVGSAFGECAAPNLGAGRDAVGNCRINSEWASIKSGVFKTVSGLATSNPEEDWGYFLTKDGSDVRWSDVAFMGVSHGATTAAIIGRVAECVWRVVSSAGPRDNTCGKGPFSLPYDPAHPPFDPNCPVANIASWLDQPSKTPMDRFYAIDGVGDGEYGDIMFNINYTKYPGQPVQFDAPGAVLTGTNRFISMGGGHLDFVNSAENVKPMNTDAVLNIAFAIPTANQH